MMKPSNKIHGSECFANKVVSKQLSVPSNVCALPIINAAEFLPHPKLEMITDCDMLLVKSECDSVLTADDHDQRYNRYIVTTKNGVRLFFAYQGESSAI